MRVFMYHTEEKVGGGGGGEGKNIGKKASKQPKDDISTSALIKKGKAQTHAAPSRLLLAKPDIPFSIYFDEL